MNSSLVSQNNWDLLVELVKTNFKMRYQNSILGVIWVLIKPYATFVVLYFVWTRITTVVIPNYQLYLLLGIIMYTFFNELIVLGQMSLLEKANIILKVNFPRQIAVLSNLISALINLGINLVFFFIIALVSNLGITPLGLVYLLVIIFIIFIGSLGISFFSSILTIRYRDLKNIIELGLFLLYWATPIFYILNTNVVSGSTSDLIALNPLGVIINQSRAALNIYGTINLTVMAGYFLAAVVLFILGWSFFNANIKKITEHF